MSKLLGVVIGSGVTLAGIIWFYLILYNWLWLGLVNSGSTGWIIGFVILFVIFLLLSIPVTAFLIIGYIVSIAVGCE